MPTRSDMEYEAYGMVSFRRDLKTFLFHSVYGQQDTDWLCDATSVF